MANITKEKRSIVIGTYGATIDIKNRVSIPAKWKALLGNEIVIKKGFDGCLEIRSSSEFQKYANTFIEASNDERDNRMIKRFTLGNAQSLIVDSWGRFVIPSSWVKEAGITKDICYVGLGNVVEIWDADLYEGYKNSNVSKVETAKLVGV